MINGPINTVNKPEKKNYSELDKSLQSVLCTKNSNINRPWEFSVQSVLTNT